MTKLDNLIRFMEGKSGIATSKQLLNAGFSAGLVDAATKKGVIDRETRGIYVLPDRVLDEFAALSLRWRRCVFSHGSALYLHGLSDRMPTRFDVTVPRPYNTSNLKAENPTLRIHRAEGEVLELGLTSLCSPSGIEIPVYDVERCICDMLKLREKGTVDMQLFNTAITGYFKQKNKDIPKLEKYAQKLGVDDDLHRYTEVLL